MNNTTYTYTYTTEIELHWPQIKLVDAVESDLLAWKNEVRKGVRRSVRLMIKKRGQKFLVHNGQFLGIIFV